MNWRDDSKITEAEGYLRRGVTSDGVIPEQDIRAYRDAVARAAIKALSCRMLYTEEMRECADRLAAGEEIAYLDIKANPLTDKEAFEAELHSKPPLEHLVRKPFTKSHFCDRCTMLAELENKHAVQG